MQRCNKVRFLYKYSVPEENSVFGKCLIGRRKGGGVGRVGAYSRLGAYQLFLPLGWAVIRGGR